jgi:peroxygenase
VSSNPSPSPFVSPQPAAPQPTPGKGTPLQQHVAFFDRNGDGIITPRETYEGCRAIGCNRLVAATAAALINGTMGWPTARRLLPTFNIRVAHIERAMHGSDTRLYDEHGHFDADAFAKLFDEYDRDGDGYWSLSEFLARARAQRNVMDLFGQTASVLEFAVLYYLVGRDGRLSRDDLRKCYDGSLFTELAARREGAPVTE